MSLQIGVQPAELVQHRPHQGSDPRLTAPEIRESCSTSMSFAKTIYGDNVTTEHKMRSCLKEHEAWPLINRPMLILAHITRSPNVYFILVLLSQLGHLAGPW